MCAPEDRTASALYRIAKSLPGDVGERAERMLAFLVGAEEDLGPQIADVAPNQAEVQDHLWYTLPMKYLSDLEDHLALADALGEVFALAGGERYLRYAAICRSEVTREMLRLCDEDDPRRFTLYDELVDASGLHLPHLDDLTWGHIYQREEFRARSHVLTRLEEAMEGGEFAPGGPRWRQRQKAVAARALDEAIPDALTNETWRQALQTERLGQWLDRMQRSPERSKVAGRISRELLHAPVVPGDVAEVLAPVTWLLAAVEANGKLTAKGNLSGAVVRDAHARFPAWAADHIGAIRGEDDLPVLGSVRDLCTAAGLLLRRGTTLTVTRRGARLLADLPVLWNRLASMFVLPTTTFAGATTEALLLVLLDARAAPRRREAVVDACADLLRPTWRSTSGESVTLHDVSWHLHPAMDTLRGLSLTASVEEASGSRWDRPIHLTSAGRAFALTALRHHGMAPVEYDQM